jgi:hypothetical protein
MLSPAQRQWTIILIVAAVITVVGTLRVMRQQAADGDGSPTALLATFHDVERTTLTRFNTLLHQAQGGDVTLSDPKVADTIDHELLPPWRDLDAAAARERPADIQTRKLIAALRAYAAARIQSWEQLALALRATAPAAKQAATDAYHAGNTTATEQARALAALLPAPSGTVAP